jgi:hypothetical protein
MVVTFFKALSWHSVNRFLSDNIDGLYMCAFQSITIASPVFIVLSVGRFWM